jgi:hypothetical protein
VKRIALGIGIGLLIAALPGHGHVLPHKKSMSLQERKDFQTRTIWHDKSVIRFYSRRPTTSLSRSLVFHRAQLSWTQRELRETLSALAQLLVPHKAAWLCIHRYEGAWDDPNPPYWGGLQMDIGFQRTYGRSLLQSKGTADNWTPLEQMQVAERAWNERGYYPWPNTARYCGLI